MNLDIFHGPFCPTLPINYGGHIHAFITPQVSPFFLRVLLADRALKNVLDRFGSFSWWKTNWRCRKTIRNILQDYVRATGENRREMCYKSLIGGPNYPGLNSIVLLWEELERKVLENVQQDHNLHLREMLQEEWQVFHNNELNLF